MSYIIPPYPIHLFCYFAVGTFSSHPFWANSGWKQASKARRNHCYSWRWAKVSGSILRRGMCMHADNQVDACYCYIYICLLNLNSSSQSTKLPNHFHIRSYYVYFLYVSTVHLFK